MTREAGFARVPFLIVVALCLMQVAWWVIFQYRESQRVEVNEKIRLEALCYRALVSIGHAVEGSGDPRGLFERELQIDEFRDLELASEQGDVVQGVRVDAVLEGVDPGFGRSFVRPRAEAVGKVLDEARSKRRMFAAEGITFTLVVLAGVVLLYTALGREMRMRRLYESFVAGATHEMKTPLATLRLGLQTLEQGWTQPELARKYLHQMVGQVDRLRMQIDNLLREAHGEERLNLLPGDLVADLREVVAEMELRCEARQIGLQAQLDGPVAPIERDKEALQHAVRNLLDNALKYSPADGCVHLELEVNDDVARVRVRDEGPGIAEEDRESIFDKFYRGQAQPTAARGGTGLGLYVARQMARAHGGDLRLCRQPGPGACFELDIPLRGDGRRAA